jgi:ADP-ribose pyrophosphatase
MEYRTIHSETIYHGRVFDVRQDSVEIPDGNTIRIDVISHHGAVTIIPVDETGSIWLVRQYRHPAEEMLLELPAGVVEEGELPEAAAIREAREEIGMAASRLEKIGEFYLAPGYSTEYMRVYLATGLTPSPLPKDPDEDLSIEKFPIEKVYEIAQKGEIRDAKTLGALFLARTRLIKSRQ